MRLNVVPARTGIEWVRQGIRTFRKQPLGLAGLFFLYWFTIVLVAVVPLVGLGIALVLVPAGTLGFMVATSDVDQGRFPLPQRLLAGFRAGRDRSRVLLQLGAAHAVIILLIVTAATALFPVAGPPTDEDPLQLLTPARLVATLLQLPVSVLFCYAPALSHWHGVPATKALFFSVVALWRNLGAFTVYGLAWAAVLALALGVLTALTATLGASAGTFLAAPLLVAVAAMVMASSYFTFRDSFTADDPPPGIPPTDDGATP